MNKFLDAKVTNKDIEFSIKQFENFINTGVYDLRENDIVEQHIFKKFSHYYYDLKMILLERQSNIDIFTNIRDLLTKKEYEYTKDSNRISSFLGINQIVRDDLRVARHKITLKTEVLNDLIHVILQAKHRQSIEVLQPNDQLSLIMEKYIDCLNYYILYLSYYQQVK